MAHVFAVWCVPQLHVWTTTLGCYKLGSCLLSVPSLHLQWLVFLFSDSSMARLAAMYRYDFALFKERFIGPDGVPWHFSLAFRSLYAWSTSLTSLQLSWGASLLCIHCFCLHNWGIGGILELSSRAWFKEHPILSRQDPWFAIFFAVSIYEWFGFMRALHWKHLFKTRIAIYQKLFRPLVIHGDDAESHRRRSFTVTTFGGVVVTQCSL